jgi:hypothetical protein
MVVEQLFLLSHGARHARSRCNTIPVLGRPHALQMEKSYPVAVLKDVIKVRLKAGHGTEIAIDERDAPFFSGQVQALQEIAHPTSGW